MSKDIKVPVCLVGSITKISDDPDICMDGATHYLNGASPEPVRLKATNKEAQEALETFTDAKVLVQVCGYNEQAKCHRIDVYYVAIANEAPLEIRGLPAPQSSHLLPYDSADVVPGIVNDTYFLIVAGTAPCQNTNVSLQPRVYVDQPDYWGIEVVGNVEGGICLPAQLDWTTTTSLQGIRGKKGIDVIGANKTMRFDVP